MPGCDALFHDDTERFDGLRPIVLNRQCLVDEVSYEGRMVGKKNVLGEKSRENRPKFGHASRLNDNGRKIEDAAT